MRPRGREGSEGMGGGYFRRPLERLLAQLDEPERLLDRGSASASGMTSRSMPRMAWAQKASARGVSVASSPTLDLNHGRSRSKRLTSAIGAWQACAASRARPSNCSSATVLGIR